MTTIKSTMKKPTVKKTTKDIEDLPFKILSTAKCQTLSEKSTLTYNIAVDDKGVIFLRVNSNTGGGFFSKEWVSLNHITSVLEEIPEDHPISSIHLFPLFKGKSVNTPGYLLAVLLNEKLLTSFQGKKRQYVYRGAEAFLSKIDKLKQSNLSK